MFLGDELTEILQALVSGKDYRNEKKHQMEIGVTVLPHFPKDTTDRNRASPFAFTGNKFEFRMLGSAASVSGTNIMLNTAVAESLCEFADVLETADDFTGGLTELIKKTIRDHERIIFNDNNYSGEWAAEAEKRGLLNLKTTVDARLLSEKNIRLFAAHGVYTEAELRSQYEIQMENYCKTLHIEALTMTDMVNGGIIPACIDYQNELLKLLELKKHCGDYDASLEEHLLGRVSKLSASLLKKLTALENVLLSSKEERDSYDQASFCRDSVFTAMSELRLVVDELETVVAKKHWPLPSYAELLYSVM